MDVRVGECRCIEHRLVVSSYAERIPSGVVLRQIAVAADAGLATGYAVTGAYLEVVDEVGLREPLFLRYSPGERN